MKKKTEVSKEERFQKAQKLIIELASGNFEYRASSFEIGDELDAIITGVNLLGEELQENVASKIYFESIFHGIKQPVFILDDHFIIRSVNSAVEHFLDFEPKELENEPFTYLLERSSNLSGQIGDKLNLRINKSITINENLISKSSKKSPFLLTFSLLRPNKKLGEGSILCLAQDISDLKKKEKKINQLNTELNTLLYQISHELRSPVANIIGLVKLCQETENDKDFSTEHLKSLSHLILRSAEKLDELLGGFNTLVKAYDKEKSDTTKAFLALEALIKPLGIIHNNLDIEFDIDVPHDLELDISEELFTKCVNAIVRNSIDFRKNSFEEDTPLTISIIHQETNRFHQLNFLDNGSGISETTLLKITDMFFKGTANSAGSGFGLYLVKKVMDSVDGKVKIESEENEYTSVTLSFPK